MQSSPPNPQPPHLYLAYGSNLSLTQMSLRCPTAKYHSLAILKGWKWLIGERGYANIIRTKPEAGSLNGVESLEGGVTVGGEEEEDWVYGMLYLLQEEDERTLDVAEGVPWAYEKVWLGVEVLTREGGEETVDGLRDGGEVVRLDVLVYVDRKRLGEGVCKEEYVARMNRGIKDAVKKGMPLKYVDGVLRRWVRDEDVPKDREVEDPFLDRGGGGLVRMGR